MEIEENPERGFEAFHDCEARALPLNVKRAVQLADLDALRILTLLTWVRSQEGKEGSEIGVLRYWSRVLRRETKKIV